MKEKLETNRSAYKKKTKARSHKCLHCAAEKDAAAKPHPKHGQKKPKYKDK